MILSLFRKDPIKEAAEALYGAAAEQARRPEFYTNMGVEDSIEGRFELLTLHIYLLLRRLKTEDGPEKRLSQHVFDLLFANLDGALREMGVGDLSVSRKIRAMAEAFYGRIGAYERATAATAGERVLEIALGRNIYGDPSAKHADVLGRYVRRTMISLAEQPDGRMRAGIVRFPNPPNNRDAEDRAH